MFEQIAKDRRFKENSWQRQESGTQTNQDKLQRLYRQATGTTTTLRDTKSWKSTRRRRTPRDTVSFGSIMAEPMDFSHAHVDMNERLHREGDTRARSSFWSRSGGWRREQDGNSCTNINHHWQKGQTFGKIAWWLTILTCWQLPVRKHCRGFGYRLSQFNHVPCWRKTDIWRISPWGHGQFSARRWKSGVETEPSEIIKVGCRSTTDKGPWSKQLW